MAERRIHNLKPEDVTGLGFWFWYRDGVATATDLYRSTMWSWEGMNTWQDWTLVIIATVCLPLVYLIMPFFTAFLAEKNILTGMRRGEHATVVYSKEAINYFTVLQNLRK